MAKIEMVESAGAAGELLALTRKMIELVLNRPNMTKEDLVPILQEIDAKARELSAQAQGEMRTKIQAMVANFEENLNRFLAQTTITFPPAAKIQALYNLFEGSGTPEDTLATLQTPDPDPRATDAPDLITCLECGAKFRTLRVHLRIAHKLSPAEYRTKHGLDPGTPLVCEELVRLRRDPRRGHV